MSLTLYDDDTKSGNEGGFTALPPLAIGEHDYDITAARLVNFQNEPLGVDVTFKHVATGKLHGNLYAVFGSHEVSRRIAREKLKALGDSCGLSGKMTLDRLDNFLNNRVRITVTKHNVSGDKTYAEISTTYHVNGDTPVLPSTPPADKDEIPMEHSTDQQQTVAEETAAAVGNTSGKTAFQIAREKRLAAAAAK